MTVKTSGAEWRNFYADESFWPKGVWHENEQVRIDGKEPDEDFSFSEIDDAAVLTISGDIVYLTEEAKDGPSLEAHFKQWRKKQKTAVLVIEVPREAVKTVLDVLATVKGEVRK